MSGSVTISESTGSGSASLQLLSSRQEQNEYGSTIYHETYQFTASADVGWAFSKWEFRYRGTTTTGGSSSTSEWTEWYDMEFDNPATRDLSIGAESNYAVVSYDYQVRAVFTEAAQYAVTTASDPAAGGTTTGGGTYASGASCTITATAASGYHFEKWVCSDGSEITDASYTFTVGSSLTFTAQFAEGTGMPLCDGTSGQIMFGSNGEILFDG